MKTVGVIAIVLLLIVGSLIGCQQSSPVRPSPPTPTMPSAPSNLAADAVSPSQVRLHWLDSSNNEEGFKLYRDNSVIATLPANTTAYEDMGLRAATTYQYVIKAYNQAGESGCSFCTVRTPNPPIMVRLDRIGVYDNREPWTRGEAGEVYVGIIITDGNTIVEKRFPAREGQFYKLGKNETVDVGATIFSVDEVGDELRIAAIGYEDDGGPGERMIYQALGLAAEAYMSGGAATILEMSSFGLGNILAKLFGAEDDWLGSYENSWTSNNNWGIGRYTDIACEDERGILCLRLWFTIESPMEPTTSTVRPDPQTPLPPTPTPSPEAQQFVLVRAKDIEVACPKGWESNRCQGACVYNVSRNESIGIYVAIPTGLPENYSDLLVESGAQRIRVSGYVAYKGESTHRDGDKQVIFEDFNIIEDDKVCFIRFLCDVDKLGTYEPIFEYVLDSFRFL